MGTHLIISIDQPLLHADIQTGAMSIPNEVLADPGLPVVDPTSAFWQLPPHQTLSKIQSPSLLPSTDITIVGSGITSASVIKTLLENDPSVHITILEARGLTSGATGRNGGHLISAAAEGYSDLIERFGSGMARKIAAFTLANVKSIADIATEYVNPHVRKASELRTVESVSTYTDEQSFTAAKASLRMFEAENPEWTGLYRVVESNEAETKYDMKSAGYGCIVFTAGALWPYRLVTGIFEQLVELYPKRLTIETFTPVEDVLYKPEALFPYAILTPRGTIQSRHVVYCTNGHTGHLLPRLRGHIFPIRGTMTVQSCSGLSNMGDKRSWGWNHSSHIDPQTQTVALGLYYLAQNAITGDFFLGGERTRLAELLSADDSRLNDLALNNLASLLPEKFKGKISKPVVKSAWSGIMGYTADGLPLAGRVPGVISGRGGQGEWIAAGFNGYGMANCWLTGEAVAKMLLGQDVSAWLPEAYLLNEERLRNSLLVEKALEKTFGLITDEGAMRKDYPDSRL